MPPINYEIMDIDVADLLLDTKNPRFEIQKNQRDALIKMVDELGVKLLRLAKDIAINGINPSEMPITIKLKGNNRYQVLEGNRRVAALKLISETKLIDSISMPPSLARRFKEINTKHGSEIPFSIKCVVGKSRNIMRHWIELRHTGENDGIGIITWSGVATARFKGETPENQLIRHVLDSEYLDSETRDRMIRMPITNLQRLLGTPQARDLLGVDVKGNELRIVSDNRDETIGRLAIVVSDIANKHIKVRQLLSKEERIKYAIAVAGRELPGHGTNIDATELSVNQQGDKNNAKQKTQKRKSTARNTLIPKKATLIISQHRIASIYKELTILPIDKFINSCAVLLRVFLEMSLDEYAVTNNVILRKSSKTGSTTLDKEMNLKEKVAAVVDDLVKNDPSCKNPLHGIRTQAGSANTIVSIRNWHAYVHNKDYSPIASELKTIWDNIQPLFENIWAK